jgi:hypothetical protein
MKGPESKARRQSPALARSRDAAAPLPQRPRYQILTRSSGGTYSASPGCTSNAS